MRLEHAADTALRAYVEHLWSVERTFLPPTDTFTLLPDRHVELVFSAGAPFVADPEDADVPPALGAPTPGRLPRAYVVGLLDGPVRLRAHGSVRVVAARCHAWSAAPLLAPLLDGPTPGDAIPVTPVAGGIRPLHAAHAPLTDAIAAHLDASDVGGALGRLHDALRALAAAAPAIPAAVRRAARALGAGSAPDNGPPAGGAPVRAAAAAAGHTPRQLERQFRALAGVTPKGYARRARFERARDRLWAAPDTRLSALAAACGYADQAHLSRDFAAFAGVSPGRWAAGIARTRALLHPPTSAPPGRPARPAASDSAAAGTAREVAFLQDR